MNTVYIVKVNGHMFPEAYATKKSAEAFVASRASGDSSRVYTIEKMKVLA